MRAPIARTLATLVLTVGLVTMLHGQALAATIDVDIVDNDFDPALVKPKQGDVVRWTNTGFLLHTASSEGCSGTGTSGVALFCSPTLDSDDQFSFTLRVAAKYPYICVVHPAMEATAQVAMKASPGSGGVGTEFLITWSRGNVPTGFNADIQIKRPGSASFVDWMTNRTGTQRSAKFVPDAGTGTYQFRSRLQNTGTGGASLYSAAKKITVA